MHTLFVDDLEDRVARIAENGIEPAQRETYSNGVRKVTYRDPDGNFVLVAVESTDKFARQLVEITDALGPTLQQTQAVSTATVAAAAVLSSDGNRVVVDLYLDQTIENANTESPRVDRNRMEVTVLHVGDAWLLDQVEAR